jgi:two-component system chemotaxis sensor kinase CheA
MSLQEDEMNEFRLEALELLEMTEKSLMSIESGGSFKTNYDLMFRVFHNLKGASGMMGLEELGKLMHRLENLLTETKTLQFMTQPQIEEFFKGVDQARLLLNHPQPSAVTESTTPDKSHFEVTSLAPSSTREGLNEFIVDAHEIIQRTIQQFQDLEKNGESPGVIDSLYREMHSLKGGAYLFAYQEIGDLAHAIESVLERIRLHQVSPTKALYDGVFAAMDLMDQSLKTEEKSSSQVQERFQKSILFFQLFEGSKPPTASVSEVEPVPKVETTSATPPSSSEGEGTIRVSVSVLDKMMALMGEMVLVRNQMVQYSQNTDDLEFVNLSQRLNVVTGELQGEMMKTRMQPVGQILSKFSRLTRELSKNLGKKIDLEITGSETELDKSLLEAIKDPLTHIVRNSCDHGIESPEERLAAGKPETGKIHIHSYHEGGQVVIQITDDGRGLNREKILAKAIEKGLVGPDRAKSLSENEITQLIFAPGFSTASSVTNVSGRGVGMDVVRTNVEKIGGSVDMTGEAGKGTTLKLRIPLTLAILPALIVKCAGESFSIPQLKLVELVRVDSDSTSVQIENIQGALVFRLRGQILPLIDLAECLKLSKDKRNWSLTNIVVLKSDHLFFGLIVDEILDTADVVVKPLARFLRPLGVYSGATIMGDGSLALILDVAGLIRSEVFSSTQQDLKQGLDFLDSKRRLEDLQDFLLIRLGVKSKYGLLLGYVQRLEEFSSGAVEVSGHQRVVRYRDSVLPLISVQKELGLSSAASEKVQDIISVIVIEKAGSLYGLEVEEILDVLTTEAPLDTNWAQDNGIIGNLISDGEIIVTIDPYKIIQRAMRLEGVGQAASSSQLGNMNRTLEKPVRRILYVEDAAFFRRHVCKTLQAQGLEVVTANNGREACELLEKSGAQPFDLIVSDIEMPVMNGFEFAKSVRKSAWSHLPLIALSTRSDQSHVEKGLEAGFDAYLEKMNPEELIQTIRNLSAKGAA